MAHHRPPLPPRLQSLPRRRASPRTHQASAGDRRTVPSGEPERNGLFGFTGDVEPAAPHTTGGTIVHFANSKKNEDIDRAVKVYKRCGGCCWDSKELDQPATFEELGMDPENNNGIISDLLTFVMEKESHKKEGKAWTRCYVLYEPPGTDRSSLIGAMASYLKFDIYNVDLMSLSSISELKKVLGSTQNHSLIAIQDYNLRPKNQLTVPCLLKIIDSLFLSRGDEHIIVFTTNHRDRQDVAPVDTDMHIYTSSPRPSALSSEFADTNRGAHLVRQDQSRSTASPSDKKRTRGTSNSEGKTPSISLEVLQQHFGSTSKQAADNLKVSVSTLKRICRQHGIERWQNQKRNKGSQNPEPNEFQLDSFEDMNFRNTETGSMAEMPSDWEDLLALEEEPFPERNVSGSINLTVVACSDTNPCQQPMPTIPDTMPPIHMMPHLACSDPAPCQQPMLTISNTMPTIHMLPHFAAREDVRFVTLKVTYGKEKILKFMFPLMSGIIELKEEVKKRLKLELGSFDIKYEDEEGDRIFLACDEDLRCHLQLFSNQVIRLFVVDSDANTLDFC